LSEDNDLVRTEKPLGVTLNVATHKFFELFWLMITFSILSIFALVKIAVYDKQPKAFGEK